MICDDCKHLELRTSYKIVCKVHEHQMLDVKECMRYEKKDDE